MGLASRQKTQQSQADRSMEIRLFGRFAGRGAIAVKGLPPLSALDELTISPYWVKLMKSLEIEDRHAMLLQVDDPPGTQ